MEAQAVQQQAHEQAIVEVALDYFEGWFSADAERMERALHPGLAKRRLADDAVGLNEATAAQMIEGTAAGMGLDVGDPGEIEVEVIDVHEPIATAVVRSAVYHEYLHLAQTGEGWKIVNTLYVRR